MRVFFASSVVFLCLAKGLDGNEEVIENARQRALDLLGKMTLDEKLSMLHGTSGNYVGNVAAIPRLAIPALNLNDGPQGFRDDAHPGTTTMFPSGGTVSASFDVDLLFQWGQAMGREFAGKGSNVQLGPGMNVARVPQNGRNFEYLSGADPFLGNKLAQGAIKGIQSTGVIANAKHWVENNQETNRDTVDETVDERTRFELYYPPFEGAINAGVGSFMCSYNKINTLWSCENPTTLQHDLKEVLGFKDGWVMSDWGATHSTSIVEGLDQEMPSGAFFGDKLKQDVEAGTIPLGAVDDAVARVLTPMFAIGLFDRPANNNTLENVVTSLAQSDIARDVAAQSMVLLKNIGNLLPFPQQKPIKIAVMGMGAVAPIVGGGGSGAVFPSHVVTPYQALSSLFEIPGGETTYQCSAETESDVGYAQWGCECIPSASVAECCTQCGAYQHCTTWTFKGNSCCLYPTSSHKKHAGYEGVTAGSVIKTYPVEGKWQCNDKKQCLSFASREGDVAISLAKEADLVLIIAGTFAKEGNDRPDLSLKAFTTEDCNVVPEGQDELISSVASVSGAKTVVALTVPGAVLTPWRDQVASLLWCGFPGQEFGRALLQIVSGEVVPSGKLPISLPVTENDMHFTKEQFPGVKREGVYSEHLLIDYRYYTATGTKPAFSFGHGLSYTTFSFASCSVDVGVDASTRTVACDVTNTGTTGSAGREVAQLYLSFPPEANEPPLQLKGFVKTALLQPGASQRVFFTLTGRDFSIWQVGVGWKIIAGTYTVRVGSSSDKFFFESTLTL
jgi:beta-glucosidase